MSVSLVSVSIPLDNSHNQNDNDSDPGQSSTSAAQHTHSQSEPEPEPEADSIMAMAGPSTILSTPTSTPSSTSSSSSWNPFVDMDVDEPEQGPSNSRSVSFRQDNTSFNFNKFQWSKVLLCAVSILVLTAIVFAIGIVLVKTSKIRNQNSTFALKETDVVALALPHSQRRNDIFETDAILQDSEKCYQNINRSESEKNGRSSESESVTVQILILKSLNSPSSKIQSQNASMKDLDSVSISNSSSIENANFNLSSNLFSDFHDSDSESDDVKFKVTNNVTLTTVCGATLDQVIQMAEQEDDNDNLRFQWRITSASNQLFLSINNQTEDPETNLFWRIYVFSTLAPLNDSLLNSNSIGQDALKNKSFFLSKDLEELQVETKRVSYLFWLSELHIEIDGNNDGSANEEGGKFKFKAAMGANRSANASPAENSNSNSKSLKANSLTQILLFLKAFLL